jgi:hypothetical protein
VQHVPPCHANAVEWTISAQGATQGLMISVGIASKRTCRLPTRPAFQVLVGGHPVRAKQSPFELGA